MSLLKSIATVSGFTMISRIIGFIRDVLIARYLGATMLSDAFFVALRFPNLFRSLFAEGTLNVSFVPIFSKILKKKGKKRARLFAKEAFSLLFYILLIFTILIEILMPFAMIILAPGFDQIPGKIAVTTELSRITFPFLLAVSLVSLLSGVLNSIGKFAAAAFTPCLLNLMMIGFLVFFSPFMPNPAYALAWGVFVAGIVELAFLLWNVYKNDLFFGIWGPIQVIRCFSQDIKTLFKRMLPGVFGAGVYQINLFLDTFFVSFLIQGAVSWLNYAYHLFQLPIGIIGVAIGTALLPILSRCIQDGDYKKAHHEMNRALEVSLLMSVSSMVGLFILAVPIVSVLFERGAFTYEETLPTAYALKAFSIGLPAYMLTKSLMPFFYAKGDTATPVKIATVGVIINAVLCLILMQFWGHVGIALATGITVWINAGQYVFLLRRKGDFKLDNLFKFRVKRIFFATLLMGVFLISSKYSIDYYYKEWLQAADFVPFFILFLLIGGAIVLFFSVLLGTKGILWENFKGFFIKKKINS